MDYDGQNERYKEWRAVTRELHPEVFVDFPIEGPLTVEYLAKHMERHGRTPRGWLDIFVRDKGLVSTDRVVHELRVLVEILELGGSYDQLNIACLASFEFLCRRIQTIVDAHAINPQKPNYDAASFFSGIGRAVDGVAPELRAHAARRARDEAEVEKQRQKVRELRGKPDKTATTEAPKK